jgi:tripartite-type tricarboxylate transporter receptor subunit TctC
LIAAAITSAAAQHFPSRPIRYIAPFPPGGGVDVVTRIVAAGLSETLGQQIVVDNRGGAGGTIGAEIAARATPDGYTIVTGGIASHGISPAMYAKLGYDALRDFAPVSMIGTTPNVLVVHPSVPAKTVAEFVAHMKANPGRINYGSPGVGTSPHLSMELFKQMTGIDMVHIAYKGSGPAIADLLGGQILTMLDNLTAQMAMIRAGRVRALAVSTRTRTAALPDVPTIAQSGVPGFDVTVWYAVFAPAGVPPAVLARLVDGTTRAVNSAEVRRRLGEQGADAMASTPAELLAFTKTEIEKWTRVVRDAKVPRQ